LKPLDLDVLLAKLRVFLDLDSALRQIGIANEGLKRKVDDLGDALAKVKELHGHIPICAYCHKIRDEAQAWQVLEAYITERSDAKFSHGICPGCHATHIEHDVREPRSLSPEPFGDDSSPPDAFR
jgi:hypothetical protein